MDCLRPFLILCLTLILCAPARGATDYVVAPFGVSGNSGATTNSPKDLQSALNLAGPGATVLLMDGYYPAVAQYSMTNWGLSVLTPIYIRAMNPWQAIIASNTVMGIDAQDSRFIVVDGLKIVQNSGNGLKIGAGSVVKNCYIAWNGTNSVTPGQGIAGNSTWSGTNLFEFNVVLGNGNAAAGLTHGLYLSGRDVTVRNNLVVSNAGYGIHCYVGGSAPDNDNMRVYNNYTFGHANKWGILVQNWAGGNNPGTNWVYHNTILDGGRAQYGTAGWSNNIIYPSPNAPGGEPITVAGQNPIVLWNDYNYAPVSFALDASVANGPHDVINAPAFSTIIPGWASGRPWLTSTAGARNRAYKPGSPTMDWWGRSNLVEQVDVGCADWFSQLVTDSRNLIDGVTPFLPWTPLWDTTVPPSRLLSWSDFINGVQGGIPTGWTNFCDVTVSIPGTNIVAIPNSTNDCAVAIATAIQLAAANGAASNRVVYMPAGTYLLKTNIYAGGIAGFATLHNVILRGAGTNATILQADFTNNTASIFNVGGFSQNGTARSNAVDVLVGSTNIFWTNTTGVAAGTMIMLWENDASTNVFSPGPSNGSADPVHYQNPNGTKATASAPLVRQLFMVQNVSGSNITVWPPSNFDFHANYSQGLVFQTYSTRYFGLENFTLKNMPGGLGTNTLNNFLFTQTYGCWLKNVVSDNAKFAHINAQYCLNNTVFGSRLVGAPATGPSQGVGLHFASHNTNWKIENSVFDSNFPAIEFYLGSSGMAVLYNAAVNCKGGLQAFDFHNAHHSKNLFEGNIANAAGNDAYFGSAEQITLHRNWFHGTPADTGFRRCVDLGSYSRNWNVVNNILGEQSVSWVYDGTFTNGWSGGMAAIYRAQPQMGNTTFTGTNSNRFATNTAALDLYCYTNLIRHLNFDNATDSIVNDSSITNASSPTSLYSTYNSTNAPSWYTNAVWPPIGTELATMTNGNMAWNYYYGLSVGGGGSTATRRGFRAFRF